MNQQFESDDIKVSIFFVFLFCKEEKENKKSFDSYGEKCDGFKMNRVPAPLDQ
jgi:hypothetical protein